LTETRRASRARAKREQIREGARRAFLEKGFSGASTDGIAAEAGVSKQTLYAYYPSKEDLLFDVLRRLVEDGGPQEEGFAAARCEPLGSREEVREALLVLSRELVSALMRPEYVALVRVVIAETPRLPHLGELFRAAVPERVLGGVAELLQQAREEGAIRPVNADAASRMLVGPLLTYVLMDGLFVGDGPPRPPSPEKIEEIVDLYVEAIT
jgi:TetR/AcrR family transcriptional regulator, mexJK operon transcriptional repressor